MELALSVREGVVSALVADAGVTAVVPGGSIFGQRVPVERTFPFIRLSPFNGVPERAACWNGERIAFTVHSFVKGLDESGAANANAAVKTALDGQQIVIVEGPPEERLDLVWTGGLVLPDPEEKDAWHGTADFEAV